MKLHHALTDGIGGVQIAAHVVDLEPEPAEFGPMPDKPVARASRPSINSSMRSPSTSVMW